MALTADVRVAASGAIGVGFGDSGTPRRAIIYQPSVTRIDGVGFGMSGSTGSTGMKVFLYSVDGSFLPNTLLKTWTTIPNGSLSTSYTIFDLNASYGGGYASLTTGGTWYAVVLEPQDGTSYRDVLASGTYDSTIKNAKHNGTAWSADNTFTYNFGFYYDASLLGGTSRKLGLLGVG